MCSGLGQPKSSARAEMIWARFWSDAVLPPAAQALASRAPTSRAATSQASAMAVVLATATPTHTSARAGTSAMRPPRKAANSSPSMVPAASQMVTVVAPASTAHWIAWMRKSRSARVASSARNSTSAVRAAQAATISEMVSSMAAGFLCERYSICTVLTGAMTWRRGWAAPLRASHVASTLSAESSTGTARTLSLTAVASDFTRRASERDGARPSTSITDTPRRSRSFAISSLPLKERAASPLPAIRFIVMSLIRMESMDLPPFRLLGRSSDYQTVYLFRKRMPTCR